MQLDPRDRAFEYLYCEICVAIGRRISRYDLWMAVWEAGANPSGLSRKQLHAFVDERLSITLREENARLAPPARRRLERRLRAFDPRHPTPEEWLLGLGRPAA